jgi:antitoxin (DNA-binding transcriptional repressor) of toxin-antitoxin stability system
MQRVPLEDAMQHLTHMIDAALSGETVVILRNGEEVVQLVPFKPVRKRRTPGSAVGQVWMADDFDAPLPELEEYS